MNICYKYVIIILLSILIITFICSIIFETFHLMGDIETKNIIKDLLISDIIITAFMILVNAYLLYTALYFFYKNQIFIFLLLMFIFLLIKIFMLIMLINNQDIDFGYSLINMAILVIGSQMTFLFISFIFGLFYRYKFIKDLDESPLNRIDEFITEDMYKNILTQSLNPNDKELKKDFEKIFEQRKTESIRTSVLNTSN